MKKQLRFWDGDGAGKLSYPGQDTPPPDGKASKADVHDFSTGQEGDFPDLSHGALTQDPQEREVNSAASSIIQIEDKLKMRGMSEDLLASHRGKVGACLLSCGKKGLCPA